MALTHGRYRTKEYRAWEAMKRRCQNKNDSGYFRYGGRGITVCRRWQLFEYFYFDMGKCPRGMSLE